MKKKCKTCDGRYVRTQGDGTLYFHVCSYEMDYTTDPATIVGFRNQYRDENISKAYALERDPEKRKTMQKIKSEGKGEPEEE